MGLRTWLAKAIGPQVGTTASQMVPAYASNFWGWLREPFAGAWQKNITPDQPQNIMAFSSVYSCVTLICDDIAKMRLRLMEETDEEILVEVTRNSPFLPVIKKPNDYQNRIQFFQQWLASKLLHGNTYVLKERDQRGVVVALYVLNPFYVTPLVAQSGDVYYQLQTNWLAHLQQSVTIPASEIIHDRCAAIWHPLVGVAPIYAAGAAATQGIRIQNNSAKFFENMSRPSGQLTSPGTISDETAARLKREFEQNFSGDQIGRLLVTGDGLKYEPMTMPAQQAQLIEQLKWTTEDVARAFKVPLYKIGGEMPPAGNMGQLKQEYYDQTLHIHVEGIELAYKEGLGLDQAGTPNEYYVRFDLDALLRMDPGTRAETSAKLIQSAVATPNEERKKENRPKVEGGDTPYLQVQNYSLAALAKRDAAGPPPSSATPQTQPPSGGPPPSAPPTPEPTPSVPPKSGHVIEGEFVVEEDAEVYEELCRNAPPLIEFKEAA